ncbi:MAG: PQQ-binding-like beta-propeller repeat protein, partial [Myxococcales bacterium]|nr:PQQ-binding-like beta-propeller repeat protein [Myxococcales bacterium]
MWQRLGILRKLCWLSLALCLTFAGVPDTASGDAEGWLVRGGNARRTGRAQVAGPQSGRVAWSYLASDGLGIHMEPTVTRDGVFFGTWGLIRKHGESPASWDRFDGAIVGLELGSGRPLWEPVRPGVTPYAYAFAGRKATLQDRGAGKGLHMSAYNGTVEGSAAVDPDNGTLYFGRGDGRLYAVDPRSGAIAWSFQTGDPARSDDPESGGQIVGGPLLTPGGSIVFATYGVPASDEPPGRVRHQTHAIYAVNRDGTLRWRHPAQGSLPNPFMAPVALSRSGKRLYAITLRADTRHPAHLLALDAESGEPIWEMTLDDRSGQDLAVGVDGRIYVAGLVEDAFGRKPAAFAVVDQGQRGGLAWTTSFAADRPRAHGAGGLALDEDDVAVRHVYVSTTNAQDSSARG